MTPLLSAWIIGVITLACFLRPFLGLNLLLATLILGDRTAAHLFIPVLGRPLYMTETALAALFLNQLVTSRSLSKIMWPKAKSWRGLYAVSFFSFLRGILVYPLLDVLRDAALVYYSFFTFFMKRVLNQNFQRVRTISLTLGVATLLKAVLAYSHWHFFYLEGSAAGMYTACTLCLAFFTIPLWGDFILGYPVTIFLVYQMFVYVFRSSWIGFAAGLLFYYATGITLRFRLRDLASVTLICVSGFLLSVFVPNVHFTKAVGRANTEQLISAIHNGLQSPSTIPLTSPQRTPAPPTHTAPTPSVPSPISRAAEDNPVLAQMGSFTAGHESGNVLTRIWMWEDAAEDVFSIRIHPYENLRLEPASLVPLQRQELSERVGTIILDNEIRSPLRKWITVGYKPLKAFLGIPFGKKFLPPRTFVWMIATRYDPHNSFVSIFYRLGIIGLITFLWLLCSELWLSLRNIRELPLDMRCFVLGYSGCVLVFCGDAFFSVSLENAFKGLLLWLFLGLLQSLRTFNSATEGTLKKPTNPDILSDLGPASRRFLLRGIETTGAFLLSADHKNKPKTFTSPQKIGFFEVDRIGDVVLAGPAVERLKKRFPTADIFFIGSSRTLDALKGHAPVDHYVALDVPWLEHRGKYNPFRYGPIFRQFRALRALGLDAGIDTRGDLRRHALMALLGLPIRVSYNRFIGGKDLGYRGQWLTHVIDYPAGAYHRVEENTYLVDAWANQLQEKNIPYAPPARVTPRLKMSPGKLKIGIHIEANWENKLWPENKWLELTDNLRKKYNPELFLFTDRQNRTLSFQTAAAALGIHIETIQAPLGRLHQELEKMDIYIGHDSGPMHLADRAGCRVLALFGPSDIQTWHPYHNGRQAVLDHQAACPYAPCRVIHCRIHDARCVRSIGVAEILQRLEVMV